jgi:predicted neuraminidase
MELMEPSLLPRGASRIRAALASLAVLLAVGAFETSRWNRSTGVAAAPVTTTAGRAGGVTLTELSRTLIPAPRDTPSAHASSLTTLPGDRLLSFWWAGSRESGPDVKVYAAQWRDGRWSAPWEVASRASLGRALGFGVRRIGNPVAWTAPDGRIHLYVVATGLGGWAASRVVHLVSATEGAAFDVVRVLPMSPLFNTSVLVRTSAVGLAGGGWWLPVYFEIGIKYPKLMTFDAGGEPTGLTRIGASTTTLQPAIVPVSGREVRAWMRDASDARRVQHAHSHDGGASWHDLPPLELNNESTSLAALRLSTGEFLMLHNHIVEGGSSRSLLRLSLSRDGRTWRTVADIASGEAGDEFSYPTMQLVGNELHLTYTHQRQAIAHHRFRVGVLENI